MKTIVISVLSLTIGFSIGLMPRFDSKSEESELIDLKSLKHIILIDYSLNRDVNVEYCVQVISKDSTLHIMPYFATMLPGMDNWMSKERSVRLISK